MIPLKQFVCDTCGEIIEKPEDGWVEWLSKTDWDNGKQETHSFNIVHHITSSLLAKGNRNGCYQHSNESGLHDTHLHHFTDDNYKMAYLLKFLDIGPYHQPDYRGSSITNMRDYVEFMRRLTIPYYEEARLYWDTAKDDGYFQDANELWVYGVDNLKTLIEVYGDK